MWIVGFGLSRVLFELKVAQGLAIYSPLMFAAILDAYLFYLFLKQLQSAGMPKTMLRSAGD